MASQNGTIADPTAVRIAKGNPGKRSLSVDLSREAQPDVALPDIPTWISAKAQKHWDRLGPILLQNKLITVADGENFAVLCQAIATLEEASENMKREKMIVHNAAGTPIENPLLAIIRKNSEVIQKLSLQFGMTPASRAKIRFPTGTFDAKGSPLESEREKFKREQRERREKIRAEGNLSLVDK